MKYLIIILFVYLNMVSGCDSCNHKNQNSYQTEDEIRDSLAIILEGNWTGISHGQLKFEGDLIIRTDSTVTYEYNSTIDNLTLKEKILESQILTDTAEFKFNSQTLIINGITDFEGQIFIYDFTQAFGWIWPIQADSSNQDINLMERLNTDLPITYGTGIRVWEFSIHNDSLFIRLELLKTKEKMEKYTYDVKLKKMKNT